MWRVFKILFIIVWVIFWYVNLKDVSNRIEYYFFHVLVFMAVYIVDRLADLCTGYKREKLITDPKEQRAYLEYLREKKF